MRTLGTPFHRLSAARVAKEHGKNHRPRGQCSPLAIQLASPSGREPQSSSIADSRNTVFQFRSVLVVPSCESKYLLVSFERASPFGQYT